MKMNVNTKKRKHLNTTEDDYSKKCCLDLSHNTHKESKTDSFSDNHYESNEFREYFPCNLIRLMHQLDLSVLLLLRKVLLKRKYPSLKILFDISEIDKFKDIVLSYKEKFICIQIENIDDNYIIRNIDYTKLFGRVKSTFYLNYYFNYFVKHIVSNSNSLFNKLNCLIIYTNSGLDLTNENRLKQVRCTNFYPIKFENLNLEGNEILTDFLSSHKKLEELGLYQFSKDKETREELLKRLEFSPFVREILNKNNYSKNFEGEIKIKFLDKLLFAVDQPSRVELKGIIKDELKKIKYNYIQLQQSVCNLASKKFGSKIIYEFNLLLSIIYDMMLYQKISSVDLNCHGKSNIATVYYKNKITYIKIHNANKNITYSQLFSCNQQNKKSKSYINKYFSLFMKEVDKGKAIKFIVIYTNVSLDLTEGRRLKKDRSKDFYPIKFDKVNIREKRYKVLRACSCITHELYQFSKEEKTREKLIDCLSSFKKENKEKLLNKCQKEVIDTFLHKLIFAVNQPNKEKLNSIIIDKLETNSKLNEKLFDYEKLHEVSLRWLESYEYGPITEKIANKLYADVQKNKLIFHKIKYEHIKEEVNLAKHVGGSEGSPRFYKFLFFIIKGVGKDYLSIMKQNGIKIRSLSCIVRKSNLKACQAFESLYKVLFDEKGNQTKYLKTLYNHNINFSTMSSIITGAGVTTAEAYTNLFHLWFDDSGNKTKYLKSFEENGIKLCHISNIVGQSGSNAAKTFKELYELMIDDTGKITHYLETLNKHEIKLSNISAILGRAGSKGPTAFKNLFYLWFDEDGNKKQRLRTLEENGVNCGNLSNILLNTRSLVVNVFNDLYDLWIDKDGNKTQYLSTLEKNKTNIKSMTHILGGAGIGVAKVYKDLFHIWFDKDGNKTIYLKTFEENGIKCSTLSTLLLRSGRNAAKNFLRLYDFYFDKNGNKTERFKILKEKGINLANTNSILCGSRSRAIEAFEKLYNR